MNKVDKRTKRNLTYHTQVQVMLDDAGVEQLEYIKAAGDQRLSDVLRNLIATEYKRLKGQPNKKCIGFGADRGLCENDAEPGVLWCKDCAEKQKRHYAEQAAERKRTHYSLRQQFGGED